MGELRHRERHVSGPRHPGQTPPDRIQSDPMQGAGATIRGDAQDGPSLGQSGDEVHLHHVSLALVSMLWAQGSAHTLVTASACKRHQQAQGSFGEGTRSDKDCQGPSRAP